MWFGRWGSAAVQAYIEDARSRSKAGSELWWATLAGGASAAWGRAPPGRDVPLISDALKEFVVEEARRAAAGMAPPASSPAAKAPPDAVHFLINRDTMMVHIVCPRTPEATLCLWAFPGSGADWERDPRKAQGSHKGKAFKPCTGCRDAATARGWLSEHAASRTAASEPASGAVSSDSEYLAARYLRCCD